MVSDKKIFAHNRGAGGVLQYKSRVILTCFPVAIGPWKIKQLIQCTIKATTLKMGCNNVSYKLQSDRLWLLWVDSQ